MHLTGAALSKNLCHGIFKLALLPYGIFRPVALIVFLYVQHTDN